MALRGAVFCFVWPAMRVTGSPWGTMPELELGKVLGRELARIYRQPLPPFLTLEIVFELLGQVFDVVRWPILNVHAKVETHARKHFFDLVQ